MLNARTSRFVAATLAILAATAAVILWRSPAATDDAGTRIFVTDEAPAATVATEPTTARQPAGEPLTPASATRRSTGAIRGRVLSSSGDAIAGVDLSVHRFGAAADASHAVSAGPKVVTDGDGVFQIDIYARELGDRGWIIARKPGYRSRGVEVPLSLAGIIPLDDILLEPVVGIAARLLNSAGAPIASATIRAYARSRAVSLLWPRTPVLCALGNALLGANADDDPQAPLATAHSDADGWFVLDELGDVDDDALLLAIDIGKTTALSTIATTRSTTQTLILGEASAIRGRVVDPALHPIANAKVLLLHRDRVLEWNDEDAPLGGVYFGQEVRTDEQGRFQHSVATTSRFAIAVQAEGFLPSVLVPAPGNAELTLHMQPAPAIVIEVVDEADGTRLPGVTAELLQTTDFGAMHLERPVGDGWGAAVTAVGDGTLSVCRGRIPTAAAAVRLRLDLRIRCAGYAERRLEGIDGVTLDTQRVALSRGATIAGLVLSYRDRQPIRGAHVDLLASPGETSDHHRSGTTNDDGTFLMAQIPCGNWWLRVSAAEYHTSLFGPLRIAEAADHHPVTLALQRPARLRGRVVANDPSLAGVALRIQAAPQDFAATAGPSDGLPRAVLTAFANTPLGLPSTSTDLDGNFAITALEPGDYVVTVHPIDSPGHGAHPKLLEVDRDPLGERLVHLEEADDAYIEIRAGKSSNEGSRLRVQLTGTLAPPVEYQAFCVGYDGANETGRHDNGVFEFPRMHSGVATLIVRGRAGTDAADWTDLLIERVVLGAAEDRVLDIPLPFHASLTLEASHATTRAPLATTLAFETVTLTDGIAAHSYFSRALQGSETILLPAGEFAVGARATGFAPAARRILVAPGMVPPVVRLELMPLPPPWRTRLMTPDGTPLRSIEVALEAIEHVALPTPLRIVRHTDGEGWLTVDFASPGGYQVMLRSPSHTGATPAYLQLAPDHREQTLEFANPSSSEPASKSSDG